MNEQEYQILDELYFIISFDELSERTEIPEKQLLESLWNLWQKKWIRILIDYQTETFPTQEDFFKNYQQYYYFASKDGLLAHNSK
ncbi:MAG: hypothetical protein NZM38_08190 [Cytophagales bacterium]|nr:hypothetical protein [Cytophagales bacterium]MDW8384736.1 hypothetical protein [Flammeovirgaceae bacterium]